MRRAKGFATWRAGAAAVVAASVLGTGADRAQAACTPAVADGVIATCEGITTDQNNPNGYGTGAENDVTVKVLSGASVTGTEYGIFLNNNAAIDNGGDILGQIAIRAGAIQSLVNSGTITGDVPGAFVPYAVFASSIGTLDNSGTITSAYIGILSLGNVGSFSNSGSITSSSNTVEVDGTLGALVNRGTIVSASGIGVGAFVDIQSLTNSGVISGSIAGVFANGNIGTLTNSGTIAGDAGVGTNGSIGTLVNTRSGKIAGVTQGVAADGDIQRLDNHGTITGRDEGVSAGGAIVQLNNSGVIATDGAPSSVAIGAASLGSITNRGLISGGEYAIVESLPGGDTTLTLLPGSVIIGGIDLGGGINTLNVETGQSLFYTFREAPVIGSTGGRPYVVSGNQVAVLDTTALASADEMLVDLTDGIFSTLQGRLSGLRAGFAGTTQVAGAGVFAPPMALGVGSGSKSAAVLATAPALRGQFWAQAFGASRFQDTGEQRLAGFVSGVDAPVSAATIAGFFVGASWADTDADLAGESTDADNVFGGAYASTLWGSSIIDPSYSRPGAMRASSASI